MLLFWDIEEGTLKKPFTIGKTIIKETGQYVLCYSLDSIESIEPAHTTSVLVQYGKLDIDDNREPKLYICHVDCIASTISAVPYKVSDKNYNAEEWLFLRPKSEWYNIFIKLIDEELHHEKYTKAQDNVIKKKQRKY